MTTASDLPVSHGGKTVPELPAGYGGMAVPELPQSKARELLDEWRTMALDRAVRVRIAHKSGLGKSEIARRMGVSRDTVYADLAGADK